MEVKIKHNNELIDATIEMVDGVMVVTPKEVEKEEVDYSQFKDGDIIVCGWENKPAYCEWVCVLKGEIDDSFGLYIEDYCSVDLKKSNGKLECSVLASFSDAATYVRYATEEEKLKLFDALAKEGKMWDEKKKAVVDLKWKPELEELYRFVNFTTNSGFTVRSASWHNDSYDEYRYKKGWIFPYTEEGFIKCQAFCDRLNQAFKDIKP